MATLVTQNLATFLWANLHTTTATHASGMHPAQYLAELLMAELLVDCLELGCRIRGREASDIHQVDTVTDACIELVDPVLAVVLKNRCPAFSLQQLCVCVCVCLRMRLAWWLQHFDPIWFQFAFDIILWTQSCRSLSRSRSRSRRVNDKQLCSLIPSHDGILTTYMETFSNGEKFGYVTFGIPACRHKYHCSKYHDGAA